MTRCLCIGKSQAISKGTQITSFLYRKPAFLFAALSLSLSKLLFRGGCFIRFDFDLLRNIEDAFYFLS